MNSQSADTSATTCNDTALFVQRVTNIDCGILDSERGLVGTTWLVDAQLSGVAGADGMLFDFGPARQLLKHEMDRRIDHRLLVPGKAPGLVRDGDALWFTTTTGEQIEYAGPGAALAVFDADAITPGLIEEQLENALAGKLPANVTGLTLHVYEEPVDGPCYNYCHGLRAHDGACQHLGHGHRSYLSVSVDGRAAPEHAAQWAARWQDVFIGARDDLIGDAASARFRFAYRAGRGDFALTLDARRCVLLDAPATVENIAAHVADSLARAEPGHEFTVRACEGIGKGAIATRRVTPSDSTERT